jgi:hypothetical protein
MSDEFKKLFIVIGTRSDDFRKGLKDVEKGLNKFKGVADLALGAGLAIAGGIGASLKTYADLGSEVYDMSKRTGLGAKTISQLKYAADQSGTSIQGLEAGIKKMQKTIYEANKGSKAASDAIEGIGLSVEDVMDLSPDEQFDKIMEAIAAVEDPTLRAGAAMDIFGRSGTDLLPILDGGVEGMNALKKKADELGVTFTDESAAKADTFGDSLKDVEKAMQGIAKAVAENLIPALQPFIDKLVIIIEKLSDWIVKNPDLIQGAMNLSLVLIGAGGLFYAVKSVVDVMKTLAIAMSMVQALSGPKGWLVLAASLALIGGATWGINKLLETPAVPGMASGGIVTQPTMAMV